MYKRQDTHCIRLVNRIGLVNGIKEPKKVEMELWKIIPPEEGSDFCHRLVYHGREVCTARTKPYCDKCCLAAVSYTHLNRMRLMNSENVANIMMRALDYVDPRLIDHGVRTGYCVLRMMEADGGYDKGTVRDMCCLLYTSRCV